MKKNILIVFTLMTFVSTYSQVLPPVNCTDAVLVCDSIITQDTIKVAGSTSADEISSNSCLPYGEVRGTWYKFGVNAIGNLRFTITPLDTTIDFDWALFNTAWNPCTDIFGVPEYEVSCNASGIGGGNYTTGATGLIQQGHNPAVNVTTPTVFYLYVTTTIDLINDTNDIMGYTIDFSASDFNLVGCTEIGIENNNELKLNVYPNPFQSNVEVELSNDGNDAIFLVYDLSGREILVNAEKKGNKAIVFLDTLSNGVYTLLMKTQSGVAHKKLLKN